MAIVATRADALRMEVAGVEIRHLHAVGAIPGVVITAVAARNGPGTGRLASSGDGTELAWRAPGSASCGPVVDCAAGGAFLLEDGIDPNKWVRVEVYPDHLLQWPTEAHIYLTDVYDNGVSSDDVTAEEAEAGDVETYEITLHNVSDTDVFDVLAWVAEGSGLEISKDGVSWSHPGNE